MDQSTAETYYRHIQLDLDELRRNFEGEIYTDRSHRIIYATDASAYRELPIAVSYPKHKEDIRLLVNFAKKHNSSLIPRTAGTSLAGQVVGSGIIVDVSKHMNRILEINAEERWIRVEPGVVLDEMNMILEAHGLFFSPETSTSNRCMIGGMIGNNSCGAHSLIYGSTRDHLISVDTILCEGVDAHFGPLTKSEFNAKKELNTFEGSLYRNIDTILAEPKNQERIRKEFPHPEIHRRNTGYAIDLLLETAVFSDSDKPFNFASLVAGSEGTLAIITEAKLNLDPLPPPVKGLICIHCHTLEDAFKGNLEALKFNPGAIELMDKTVMDLSKENITQRRNRFFIEGDPEAILIVEFARETEAEILHIAGEMEKAMKAIEIWDITSRLFLEKIFQRFGVFVKQGSAFYQICPVMPNLFQ